MLYLEDRDAWLQHPEDRWVYDRLQLADRLGYPCGPAGVPFPWQGTWCSKPISNLRGMGLGARQVTDPSEVPPGHFWMPWFVGGHISVNYVRDDDQWRPVEALQGLVDAEGYPIAWVRVQTFPPLPTLFDALRARHLNVEYIGPYVIEAHLRHGFDLAACPEAVAAMVVWEGGHLRPGGPGFVSDVAEADGRRRLGFYFLT